MITFIPTPIGNPQDITIRAMKIFETTDIFLCEDTRVTKKLLQILKERFGMQCPDAEFYSFNEHNGTQRLSQLSDKLKESSVVFVSDAGMPVVSDPGQLLVAYCQENDLPYDVLPGASAVTTIYAASGFESGKFLFYGFLPHKGKDRDIALDNILSSMYDVVLYESPHRLKKLLSKIDEKDPMREIFAAKELTKKYQKYYKGTAAYILSKLNDTVIKGEWSLVIRRIAREPFSLSMDQILNMDIPPKIKSKLLSAIDGKSVKEWYKELIKN